MQSDNATEPCASRRPQCHRGPLPRSAGGRNEKSTGLAQTFEAGPGVLIASPYQSPKAGPTFGPTNPVNVTQRRRRTSTSSRAEVQAVARLAAGRNVILLQVALFFIRVLYQME